MRDLAGGMLLQATVMCAFAVITLSPQCEAADVFRDRRGVVAPGNAASRPKDTFRLVECLNDGHCKILPKTSCVLDQGDGHMRCLCADGSHPLNYDCITALQELGMPCELDTHCAQSANCGHSSNETHDDLKLCQPDSDPNDNIDDNDSDSGGVRSMISIYLGILVAFVLQNNRN